MNLDVDIDEKAISCLTEYISMYYSDVSDFMTRVNANPVPVLNEPNRLFVNLTNSDNAEILFGTPNGDVVFLAVMKSCNTSFGEGYNSILNTIKRRIFMYSIFRLFWNERIRNWHIGKYKFKMNEEFLANLYGFGDGVNLLIADPRIAMSIFYHGLPYSNQLSCVEIYSISAKELYEKNLLIGIPPIEPCISSSIIGAYIDNKLDKIKSSKNIILPKNNRFKRSVGRINMRTFVLDLVANYIHNNVIIDESIISTVGRKIHAFDDGAFINIYGILDKIDLIIDSIINIHYSSADSELDVVADKIYKAMIYVDKNN